MAYHSYNIKQGRLRLYDGTGTPYFLEVPFRGALTCPVDRPRPPETLKLDRGRHTADSHYILGPDDPILAPLPISFNFELANTEPNFSKFLTLLRTPAAGGSTRSIGGKTWASTKGSSRVRNADPLGTALHTTPAFLDPEKFCVNLEVLWEDPDNANERGFRFQEVYFPPDRQVTEGDLNVLVDMTGEIYGNITLITSFTTGVES